MKGHIRLIIFVWLFKMIDMYTFKSKTTSYMHYEQWMAQKSGYLKFRFKTNSPYGLLIYSDNSKTTSSHESFISLILKRGKLQLKVQMGADDYKSSKKGEIGNALNDLRWHTVKIERTGRETKLILDDLEEFILINDGEHEVLELNSGLFFGGISEQLAINLVDKTITMMPRFIGCIERIKYGSETLKTKTSINNKSNSGNNLLAAVKIEEGCMDACSNATCSNNGRCINKFYDWGCNCIGTGFYGPYCTKAADSLQFKDNGYVAANVQDPAKSTSSHDIKLRFKTRKSDGVILAAKSGNDHLMLELYQTTIRLSMDLGGGSRIFEMSNTVFSDGQWHFVEILRHGRNIALFVDRKYNVNASTMGVFSKFDLRDELLYISGHPKLKKLNIINSKSQTHFDGCLQQLLYNGVDVIYKTLNTKSPRFEVFGYVKKGCVGIEKQKNKTPRDVVSNVSKSGTGIVVSKNGKPSPPSKTAKPSKVQDGDGGDGTLSKKTVIWIAAGLIVGFIVLVVSLALIVHNVRNRYSGVFLSSSFKENNNVKQPLTRTDAVVFTPRNGQIKIEPHLV